MVDKIGHIKNPLTVVAIFAGLAEVSGTVILPFVSPENQSLYILFLILFPSLLVVVFFLTLNFNHAVLYAPSDFRDDRFFLDIITKSTPSERSAKLDQEIYEVEKEAPELTQAEHEAPQERENREIVRRDIRASYLLSEELVIQKLSVELNVKIQRGVRSNIGPTFIFDGAFMNKDKFTAVEVKYFRRRGREQIVLREILDRMNSFHTSLSEASRGRFSLILAIVLDKEFDGDGGDILARVHELTRHYGYPVVVKIYRLNGLGELEDVPN